MNRSPEAEPIRVGVLTVSDGCARGEREDRSGSLLAEWCQDHGHLLVIKEVVPDEVPAIVSCLTAWADESGCDLILTTGGTGLAPRDVTPEATITVLDREAAGLADALRHRGRESTPYSVLSRGVAGTRGSTLIVNLPGSPGGVRDGLSVLGPVVGHAVSLLRGEAPSHLSRSSGASAEGVSGGEAER